MGREFRDLRRSYSVVNAYPAIEQIGESKAGSGDERAQAFQREYEQLRQPAQVCVS